RSRWTEPDPPPERTRERRRAEEPAKTREPSIMAGIIGRKIGMTRIFDDAGNAVPVTVIEAGPCPVTYVRTAESDGYAAVHLGFGEQKAKRATRAEVGHATKAGLATASRVLREFPVGPDEALEVGQTLTVEQFAP